MKVLRIWHWKSLYIVLLISFYCNNLSNSNGFRETAITALVVAIVTTFFWPKDIVVWPISSYIAGFYGYPVFLAFRWTSRRGRAAIMRIIEAFRTIRSNTPLNKWKRTKYSTEDLCLYWLLQQKMSLDSWISFWLVKNTYWGFSEALYATFGSFTECKW